MLVRIGESEKESRFVNVRLVIVVIIQSISFDIHQNKFSACVLNLLLEYHWAGRPITGAQRYGRMKKEDQRRKAPTQLSQENREELPNVEVKESKVYNRDRSR